MHNVLALTTAPSYGANLVSHDAITLIAGERGGVEGDRHIGQRRAVSIVCTGELAVAAAEHGVERIDGVSTRRNIVVDLDRLPRTHGTRFRIGETELEVWRDCAPCNLMNEFFGDGAREALQQRCGISAAVVTGGVIRVGDSIQF
ncbi:MOSC domain-containing protein [uncultured Ilumatobacter sp.]|uniref:MOSC domain-containing protein n=1 Tax=uncultured Ilumatobacter sp. TaxID=879968 RepID=UPI00374EF852